MANITQVTIDGQAYFKLTNVDQLRPFFMSIVSDSNHWMFLASNGGLSAGRKNSEYALFPYYTDDKITETAEITGSKTLIRTSTDQGVAVWEPFSSRSTRQYSLSHNLYKSALGNAVIFEAINHDLSLKFSYQWSTSDDYGFVRKATLSNIGDTARKVELVDGLQNIIPYGVGSELQNRSSNLVDAYKRNELDQTTGLGIFALSAIIVDKAEPSEALKANVVWSLPWEGAQHLLSVRQLETFRAGGLLQPEQDVKGEKGAYLLYGEFSIPGGEGEQSWTIVADVNKDHVAVHRLRQLLQDKAQLGQAIEADVAAGSEALLALVGSADGLQLTADQREDSRHYSNVLFNIMRGGIFDNNYQVEREDLFTYLRKANGEKAGSWLATLVTLGDELTYQQLLRTAASTDDTDLRRLLTEYLPLKFSRRHGDPSRPWNRFSINLRREDGQKILDYEGNWRDIFQNWEALALSYPDFLPGMLFKFLNATTFDGYNPYRVTKDGFDWETIEPDDPWSYIGYWGDHQIIYLLKFLEWLERFQPGALQTYFSDSSFVYANVPYRIKPYEALLKEPKNTVDFDHDADLQIRAKRDELGADGALLTNTAGQVCRVNMMEKILATCLAKMSNFIPDGGIWMNTQRPEWNDANNALVGNGVSMVTLYYLRRFCQFFVQQLGSATAENYTFSVGLADFFSSMLAALKEHQSVAQGAPTAKDRRRVLDALGQAGSKYRWGVYEQGFSADYTTVSGTDILQYFELCLTYIDATIANNRRTDGLYHAYNLMTPTDDGIEIAYLDEMLEGQVAVLSSGYLSVEESLGVLDALRASALYRPDQESYVLYPNKALPGFLAKNTIIAGQWPILETMVQEYPGQVITKDVNGDYHFNGNFRNAKDMRAALQSLAPTVAEDAQQQLLDLFEEVFNHKAFTGRSGTFYGYEGLGSIYWHMVSKLRLAAQECCQLAHATRAPQAQLDQLVRHYYAIKAGLGVHKTVEEYGAFPTDPYSHTPGGKGAQQPGMTGQVKEDIICRFGELGVTVEAGQIHFSPWMLEKAELVDRERMYHYRDVALDSASLQVPANALAFTYCSLPIVYQLADTASLEIIYQNEDVEQIAGLQLSADASQSIMSRTEEIEMIKVNLPAETLR